MGIKIPILKGRGIADPSAGGLRLMAVMEEVGITLTKNNELFFGRLILQDEYISSNSRKANPFALRE